jgi:hypothetical protein
VRHGVLSGGHWQLLTPEWVVLRLLSLWGDCCPKEQVFVDGKKLGKTHAVLNCRDPTWHDVSPFASAHHATVMHVRLLLGAVILWTLVDSVNDYLPCSPRCECVGRSSRLTSLRTRSSGLR